MARQTASELEKMASQVRALMPVVTEQVSLARRPLFIEFSGTPKSGKTTAVESLRLFLRRAGFTVHVLTERASVCPLTRKNNLPFNIWTGCSTLVQILEALERSEHVVIIDRGIFDSLIWFELLRTAGRLTQEEMDTVCRFFLIDRWRDLIDIVFLMSVAPEEALNREYKQLLTKRTGTIMNPKTLQQFNNSLEAVYERYRHSVRGIIRIDTTGTRPREGVELVVRRTLETISEFLQEEVMVVPKSAVVQAGLRDGFISDEATVSSLIRAINDYSKMAIRSDAEKDINLIQIIPCAIFSFNDEIYLLRRKESDLRNRLREKYVIWAGGHIRKGDAIKADPILEGLKREISEELDIKVPLEFSQLGFLLDKSNVASSMHLALVFMAKVERPEIKIAMNQSEFKEKRGTSVSGQFLPLKELAQYYGQMERWSQLILTEYFGLPIKQEPSPEILL